MKQWHGARMRLALVGWVAAVALGGAGRAKAETVVSEPTNLGPVINDAGGVQACDFSHDGLELYFAAWARPGGFGSGDIWVSTRERLDSPWQEPVNLGPNVNSAGSEVEPSISSDGLELYFSCWDDWILRVCTRPSKDAPWSKPVKIGPPVGSIQPAMEIGSDDAWRPDISSDGLSLYFSSTRAGGYGGDDIWMARRATTADPWTAPVNLGPNVNTDGDELFPNISTDGLTLVLSRAGISAATREFIEDDWGPAVPVEIRPPDAGNFHSPALSPDGSTLYFEAVAAWGGYGGGDFWQVTFTPVLDFNGDGSIDSDDYLSLSNNLGAEGPLYDIAPLPLGDGVADTKDLIACAEYLRGVRSPGPDATDVPRDVVLGWIDISLADSYDVYFGSSREDVVDANRVNPLGVLVSEGQAASMYDPDGLLAFDETYYWRIDEVGAAPDSAVSEGFVSSFTTELYAYPLETITAVSNGTSEEGQGPENTVNGSGLNADGEHSTNVEDMWLATGGGAEPLYIQYEFDNAYRLHEMLVWNHNGQYETVFACGVKDVTVEHSLDGTNWTALGDVQLAQAPGMSTYTANTVIDLAGVAARYVRIMVKSGYGTYGQYGLSGVRFFYTHTRPWQPQPADGQTGVDLDGVFDWHPGCEAVTHEVYLSTDRQAVVDSTALVDTVTASCWQTGVLEPGQTYYWRIVEVNEAETPSRWEGDVWQFTTSE
ncbi:MAG: PD40 domain-containing protein [Sedimentisphaerales bacterium]|nr:PD40 domain-containing protein [Sedimentisphaerales bacterium]